MRFAPIEFEEDPLYGDTPLGDLAMVVQCKAFVSARRHLFHVHGLTREQLRETSADTVLAWHLQAHDLTSEPPASQDALRWGLESFVHGVARGGH